MHHKSLHHDHPHTRAERAPRARDIAARDIAPTDPIRERSHPIVVIASHRRRRHTHRNGSNPFTAPNCVGRAALRFVCARSGVAAVAEMVTRVVVASIVVVVEE